MGRSIIARVAVAFMVLKSLLAWNLGEPGRSIIARVPVLFVVLKNFLINNGYSKKRGVKVGGRSYPPIKKVFFSPVTCPVSDWTNRVTICPVPNWKLTGHGNLPDRKPVRALQLKQQAICVRSHKSFIDRTSSPRQNFF